MPVNPWASVSGISRAHPVALFEHGEVARLVEDAGVLDSHRKLVRDRLGDQHVDVVKSVELR